VIRVLEPIWKTKTETASRLRGRIEAVLDWAAAHDYRDGDNPARWKGHLSCVVGDKVEAAYRRGDLFEERRKLMSAWARFCTGRVPWSG
jgi:hypothetical protein